MATILDPDKDEQASGSPEGVVQTGGGQGTIQGQGSSGAAASTGSQPGGGGFTNLRSYLDANQGNDAQMGQQVQSNVAQNAAGADQAIGGYKTGASQKIAAGTVGQDQGVQDSIRNSPEKLWQDPNAKQGFYNQYNATYTGGNDATQYDGYEDAQTKAGKVQQQGQNAAGDLSSRNQLLKDVYARPDYGQGEQTLDSFILGGGGAGSQALKNINQAYGNYGQRGTDAMNDVQGQIAQGQATTQATQDATRKLVSDQTQGYGNKFQGIQASLQQQNAQNAQAYQGELGGLKSADPNARKAAFQAAGIDPAEGEYLLSQGYDPTKLLSQGSAKGLGDMLDPTDVARYQALNQLQGQNANGSFAGGFAKTGGNGQAFVANDPQRSAADQAWALHQSLDQRVAAQQQGRDNLLEAARNGVASGNVSLRPGSLDMNQPDYDAVQNYGARPEDFIRGGRQVTAADVATDADRQQLPALYAALGIQPQNLTPSGGLGDAYSLDQDQWAHAVANARAAQNAGSPAQYRQQNGYTDDSSPFAM